MEEPSQQPTSLPRPSLLNVPSLDLWRGLSASEHPFLVLTAVLAVYIATCRALRYRHQEVLRRRFGYGDGVGREREALSRMTAHEAQLIIRYIANYEFPLFHKVSLEFALFKTYAVESISKLLLATRNLTDPIHSRKRYEDTAILIAEFINYPPASPRAARAIARMNYLHRPYQASGQISNSDLLYTLSVFVTEPVRFARLYEWRALSDAERCAYGVFWKALGDAMGIDYARELGPATWRDGLDFFHDLERWAKDYEARHMKPSTICAKPARALIPLLLYWVPGFARDFAQECVCVLLGDRARDAFMLPEPGITAATVVYVALSLRRLVLRYLCLPRVFEAKRLRDEADPDTGRLHLNYTFGNYPFYLSPTLWSRWGPRAWTVWLAGGKLPGDDPEEFMPLGYSFDDLGPVGKMGLGKEEMRVDAEALLKADRGGCPFAF